jgi:RND superfamily putative drug exporter
LAMLASDLRTIGQLGSTVCVGLLLDTLIVRSFVVPSILAILGQWFWWPTLVRTRPSLPRRASSETVQMTGAQ